MASNGNQWQGMATKATSFDEVPVSSITLSLLLRVQEVRVVQYYTQVVRTSSSRGSIYLS